MAGIDYRSLYEKEYVGSWNLDKGDWTLTIKAVKGGELHNPGTKKKTKKPVCMFEETPLMLACNATNGKTIATMYGRYIEQWRGKKITLYKAVTRNPDGSGDVDCVRVRPSVAEPNPAQAGSTDAPPSSEPVAGSPIDTTPILRAFGTLGYDRPQVEELMGLPLDQWTAETVKEARDVFRARKAEL